MQNKFSWFYVLMLSAIFPLACVADFDLTNWKYFKDISISDKGVKKIAVDYEIFSGAKKDFSDVRLIDVNNSEIPYKIVSGKTIPKQNSYSVQMINNSYVASEYSTVILDLGENGKIVNNLTIETDSENFQRNIKVYGSDDMSNWNVIVESAYIYDYTDKKGNFKSQNTKLNFSDSLFRYYKLEISDEDGAPVRIISVKAVSIVNEEIKENKRSINFSVSENKEHKATQLLADLGLDGVPLSKIDFKIGGENFNRQVLIYSSNDNNSWDYIGQDYVFVYNTPKFKGEKTEINFSETKKRYIKLEILNNDNMPVSVESLTGFYVSQEIIFEMKEKESARIYYGNQKANQPQYDLTAYFQYLDLDSAKYINISSQKDNLDYVKEVTAPLPMSERIPYLLPIVLISISGLLILLVYRFMKN